MYLGGFALLSMISVILNNQADFYVLKLGIQAKKILYMGIYKKIARLQYNEVKNTSLNNLYDGLDDISAGLSSHIKLWCIFILNIAVTLACHHLLLPSLRSSLALVVAQLAVLLFSYAHAKW